MPLAEEKHGAYTTFPLALATVRGSFEFLSCDLNAVE